MNEDNKDLFDNLYSMHRALEVHHLPFVRGAIIILHEASGTLLTPLIPSAPTWCLIRDSSRRAFTVEDVLWALVPFFVQF